MQKIQIITYNQRNLTNSDNSITITELNNPKSLDEFDTNIIDISNEGIWYSGGENAYKPNENIICTKDFKSIQKMVENSKKTTIVICLPQNIYYKYGYYHDTKKEQLKNIIDIYTKILKQLIIIPKIEIMYESSITKVSENEVGASFHFIDNEYETITKSEISCKVTTIKYEKIYLTTLDLFNAKNTNLVIPFLEFAGITKEEIEYPSWLYEYSFYNDNELNLIT